jgi:hypothetical protein
MRTAKCEPLSSPVRGQNRGPQHQKTLIPTSWKHERGNKLAQTGAATLPQRSGFCASATVAPVLYTGDNWSGAADQAGRPAWPLAAPRSVLIFRISGPLPAKFSPPAQVHEVGIDDQTPTVLKASKVTAATTQFSQGSRLNSAVAIGGCTHLSKIQVARHLFAGQKMRRCLGGGLRAASAG